MHRRPIKLALLLLSPIISWPAYSQQTIMRKDAIACWQHRDFMALVAGEAKLGYWGSHQQKRDYMAKGRCFALRRGEPVSLERHVASARPPIAKVRRLRGARSFWTDQASIRE